MKNDKINMQIIVAKNPVDLRNRISGLHDPNLEETLWLLYSKMEQFKNEALIAEIKHKSELDAWVNNAFGGQKHD